MKKFIFKILSSILSLVVVFSTLSFKVDKHECDGKITNVAVFVKAHSCGEMSDDCELSHQMLGFNKTNCCKDISQIVQSNIVIEKTIKNIEIPQIQFTSPLVINIDKFEGLEENIIPFKAYNPPKITFDLTVLKQSFLI